MGRWMRMGCTVLGLGVMACGGQMARAPVPMGAAQEPPPATASSGGGGAATVDTGTFPGEAVAAEEPAGARRELYAQVARELGLSRGPAPRLEGEGLGGSGSAGEEKHLCAAALNAREPVTVVSGVLHFTSNGLVTVEVPGKGAVKLLTDTVTCAVEARRAMAPESLSEGTEVRVAYVEGPGEPTARVIRAEPMRPIR